MEAVQLEVDLLAGQPAQGLGEDQGSDDVAVAHLEVRFYSDSVLVLCSEMERKLGEEVIERYNAIQGGFPLWEARVLRR